MILAQMILIKNTAKILNKKTIAKLKHLLPSFSMAYSAEP